MNKKHVMVAVDFGVTSILAFEVAVDLARRVAAPLDIVHIAAPVSLELQAAGLLGAHDEDANAELDRLRARAEAAGVVTATHLRHEAIVFGLLGALAELQPFVVVLGSHGRGGVPRALLGSISESIARRSTVPVLVVPSPEREKLATAQAWCCTACGHILSSGEGTIACSHCGQSPAHWTSAPLDAAPADARENAVGEGVASHSAPLTTQDPAVLFATAPAGSSSGETNAELRIRRF